ncbi:MAG: hypothetical protein LBP61_08970 [Desulfovibrio sp.]|jgi:hypothetical protein|nr:hypothetical protein [Desulfovibrio sp.]
MSATAIDSLVISLGLNPGDFMAALGRLQSSIDGLAGLMDGFAQGVTEGFREAEEETEGLAGAAAEAGSSLAEAGDRGREGMEEAAKGAKKAAAEVKTLSGEARKLGASLGGKLRGIASIAAPITGMLGAGAMAKGYMDDMEKLDKLSRKASLSMEERKEKAKLLSVYTARDLEVYRASQLALEDFGKTMRLAAAPIMQALLPALSWLLGGFGKTIKFLQEHKPFVIAFFSGMAAVITGVLIPSIWAWTKAMMANPMVKLFMAATAVVAGLALIFDDLWVYMNGGQSALSEFWSIFGTGEEIAEALAQTWEDLKAIGEALWEGLKAAAAGFFAYFGGAIDALLNVFKTALKLIKAIFTGNFDEAFEHLLGLLAGIGEFILSAFVAAFTALRDAVTGIFVSIVNGILDLLPGWLKKLLGIDSAKLEVPAGIKEGIDEADKATKDAAANASKAVAGEGAAAAADGVSPAAVAGPVSNNTEYINDFGGVTITVNSSDPAAAGQEVGKELRRMTNNSNSGMQQ